MKNSFTQNLSMIGGIKRLLFLAILLLGSQFGFAQANNLCTGAVTITCGSTTAGTTTGADNTGNPGICDTDLSTAPGVWYTFTGTGDNITAALCNTPAYDSKIGVFTGACGAFNCVIGEDDDFTACGTNDPSVDFASVAGTTYFIYVTGFGTNLGDFELTLTCTPPLDPTTNNLCADAIEITCGSTTVGTTATSDNTGNPGVCNTDLGTAPGVWYTFTGTGDNVTAALCNTDAYDSKIGVLTGACGAFNCVIGEDDDFTVCGTNDPSVDFTSVIGTTYYIYVTGFGTNSGAFELTLTCTPVLPPTTNNLCADAIEVTCGSTTVGTTATSDNTGNPGTCNTDLSTAPGVWYTFTGTGDIITAALCNTDAYDSKIGVLTGACGAFNCVIGEDDDFTVCGTNDPSVDFTSVTGTTYYIYVTGFGTNSGEFELTLTCTPPPPPANDLCADAIDITGATTVNGTTISASNTGIIGNEFCGTSSDLSSSPGVWYSYTGDNTMVTVDLCGDANDTQVAVFEGTCDALVCVDGEDDDFTVCGGNDPSVTFMAATGTNYFVYVTRFGTDNESDFTLNVSSMFAPPVATCQTAVVMLDADGTGSVTAADVDGGSTADAGIMSVEITAGDTDFTCAQAGTSPTVTLTVTDNDGQTASCDATVMVMDVMPPMVTADDITINVLPDEALEVDAAALGLDASDNCSIASVVISPNTFTSANIGANLVTITVTDASGLPAVTMVTVFVNVFEPLDMVCRQPISTCNAEGQCGRGDLIILEPYIPDNMNLASLTDNRPANGFFDVGTTEIIWTATSVEGIVSQCISKVIINDEEAPVIDCPGNIVKFLEPNLCTANFNLNVQATDNCASVSISGNGFQSLPVGLYPTEIVATDAAGNSSTCIANIAVHDVTSPEIVSCPEDVNVTAPTGATQVFVNLPQPVITDACGVSLENDAPALFPIGTTTVNWKGNDDYGNWVMCTYDVIVTSAGTVMGAMAPIEASIGDENARVNWNAPNILSYCEECADTDMANYQYLGDYYGHQYFLYTLDAVSLEQAQTLAAAMGGSVVTINTAGENDFLRGQLAQTGQNILVQTEEYDNFPADIIPIEFPETVVMNNDGYWNFADAGNTYYFVSEKACVDIAQTGPYAQVPNIYGEMETTLLTPGGEWPAGEYVVTYELTDACGASQTHQFDVTVDEAIANYCTTGNMTATTNVESVWIENVVMGSFVNSSAKAEAGYADYSNLDGLKLIVEEGQTPTTTVKLTPGGNTAGELLYWTVWADTNADGDFFDTEALLQVSGVGMVAAEMTIPVADVYGTKLRVMVSRYEYCQPCANVLVGEAEDYSVIISNTTVAETRSGKDEAVQLTTSVYPNPVSEIATLAIGDLPAGYVTVTLMDNLGRTLEVKDYEGMGNERLQFNVSNYASGLLIFKLTQDGEVVGTQRVVKK